MRGLDALHFERDVLHQCIDGAQLQVLELALRAIESRLTYRGLVDIDKLLSVGIILLILVRIVVVKVQIVP